MWQDYQVPVKWTTYRPVYEQHVREHRYTVQRAVWQDYQVPVKWTTYRPVYEQHVRNVPVTTYRTVCEPRQYTYKTCTLERVWQEHPVRICTGEWREERHYVPGPVVTRTCKLPGTWTFDPCSCKSHYCPGPVTSYQVQCPGRWVCKKVWVPREETRMVR